MPKKNSKKSTKMAEGPVVEADEEKPSITPKKVGNEIDEIFAGKKRKKPDNENVEKDAEDKETSKSDKTKKKKKKNMKDIKKGDRNKENGDHISDKPRKKTGDGLAIYTEEELGIGKADAGGTPLCPFDCDCCF